MKDIAYFAFMLLALLCSQFSEGKFGILEHASFYDLFRMEDDLIVEVWYVRATIPPKSEWKKRQW